MSRIRVYFYIGVLSFIYSFSTPVQNLYAQNSWIVQESNTRVHLNKIFFVNENYGWVCGDTGVIRKTTNGGINWINQNPGLEYYKRLLAMHFIDSNYGWAAGGYLFNFFGSSGDLCRTTNGGQNWYTITNSNSGPYSSVYFINELTGFLQGRKMTNGGISFDFTPTNPVGGVIYMDEFGTGFSIGDGPRIYKTLDSGNTWQLNYTSTASPLTTLSFLNINTGYVAGYGTILKTTNSGLNWIRLQTDFQYRNDIFFTDENYGSLIMEAGSSNNLMRTTNGGVNWYQQFSSSINSPKSIFFVDKYTGWVCGNNGLIMKTTNSGDPVNIHNIGNQISYYSLSQNYPNPFNPSTKINYKLQVTNYVTLTVYDLQGKEIATLVNKKQSAGSYSVEFNGENLSSGLYFYTLEIENFKESKKMLLVK